LTVAMMRRLATRMTTSSSGATQYVVMHFDQ